jgi:hypothetical protein
LRCIAIDLKLSSSDKQKSSIQGLLRALLSMPAEDQRKPVDTTHLSYGSYHGKIVFCYFCRLKIKLTVSENVSYFG